MSIGVALLAVVIASGVNAYTPTLPLYEERSPWRQSVDSASSRRLSKDMLEELTNKRIRGVTINTDSWTPSVVYAEGHGSRYDMAWSKWLLRGVPVGSKVRKSAAYFSSKGDSDASVCVIDADEGVNYSLYGVKPSANPAGVSIVAGGALKNNGPGWWDNKGEPWIGRASGAALCGGLVLVEELRRGELKHALAIGWPRSLILESKPSYPARTSDGTCKQESRCVPMGARIQLNPSLTGGDLRRLGLKPNDVVLAKALQTYGAYIVDSSHTVSIYVESGLGRGRLEYGLSGEWPGALLRHLSIVAGPKPMPLEDRKTMSHHIQKRDIHPDRRLGPNKLPGLIR